MTDTQLLIGIAIPSMLVLVGILLNHNGQRALNQRIDDLRSEMRAGFEAVDKRFDDVNKRFDDVNKKFDDVNRRIDDTKETLRAEMKFEVHSRR